ncbi:MAG: hypothetical protein AAFV53_15350 [Myxococcota bacterium]
MPRTLWLWMAPTLIACGEGDLKRFEENSDVKVAVNAADFPIAAYVQAIYLIDLARGSCPDEINIEEAGRESVEMISGDGCVSNSGLEWVGTILVEDRFTAERVQRQVIASEDFAVRSENYDSMAFSGTLTLTGAELNQLDILDTEDFTVTINGTTVSYSEYELIGDVSELFRETTANVSLEAEVTHEGQDFSLGGVWDFAGDCQTEPEQGALTATGDNQINITLDGSDCDSCAAWEDAKRSKRSGAVCDIRTEVNHFFNEIGG